MSVLWWCTVSTGTNGSIGDSLDGRIKEDKTSVGNIPTKSSSCDSDSFGLCGKESESIWNRIWVRRVPNLDEMTRCIRHTGIRESDFARLQTSPACQGRSLSLQNSAWLVKSCLAGLGKTIRARSASKTRPADRHQPVPACTGLYRQGTQSHSQSNHISGETSKQQISISLCLTQWYLCTFFSCSNFCLGAP
jgi:hypothetical protein